MTRKKPLLIIGILLGILLHAIAGVDIAASDVVPNNLWKGLIAEDVSGGYRGMYAVACCVRNRLNAGMDIGLVALKRKDLDAFVRKQGVKYESMAKNIVRKVFYENTPDVTQGATHYEAVERFGLPRWAKGMVRTVKISEHTFFRRR